MAKLPDLKIPHYVEDNYRFLLNYYPSKFPPLPTSKMDLAFSPSFPRWFIYGEDLKILKNESLTYSKRVTPTKHDEYSFKGHFHVDIKHARVESLIHEGEESKGSSK